MRAGLLVVGVSILAACSSTPTPAPPPATPAPAPAPAPSPPQLSGWKLTLPTANAKGDAAQIDPAQVAPPFLTTGDAGALVFWAPVAGATTKHSDHARTELNSHTPFTAGTSGKHSLTATVVVNQVPNDVRDVIIAQIHGTDTISSVPYVMLHYQDSQLKVVVKQVQVGTTGETYPLTSAVPLGQPFDIGITDNGDGTMTFTSNFQGDAANATAPVPAAFSGAAVRFQAGAYQQGISVANAAPDDGAKVTFSSLTETGS